MGTFQDGESAYVDAWTVHGSDMFAATTAGTIRYLNMELLKNGLLAQLTG